MIRKQWKGSLFLAAALAISASTVSAQIPGSNSGGSIVEGVRGAVSNGVKGAVQGAARAAVNGGTGAQVLQQGGGQGAREAPGAASVVGASGNVGARGVLGRNGSTSGEVRSAVGLNGVASQGAVALGAGSRLDANGRLTGDFVNQLSRRFSTSTRILGDGPVEFSDRLPRELRRMGFRPGDVLLNAAGEPLRRLSDVGSWVQNDGVLAVMRGDEKVSLNLASQLESNIRAGRNETTPTSANLAAEFGLESKATAEGLSVTDVRSNSLAARAGLQPGDRIVSATGQAIGDQTALNQALANSDETITLEYLRGNARVRTNVDLSTLNTGAKAEDAVVNGANQGSASIGGDVSSNSAEPAAGRQAQRLISLEARVAELERLVAELRLSANQ